MHRPATLMLRVRPLSTGSRGSGRRPAAALAAVLVGSSIALAACQTQSPVQTDVPYQPADGINVNLGTVDARGLVLVTAAKGAAGVVVGSLINNSRDPVTVTFLTPEQAQSSSANGPSVQLSGNQQMPITGIDPCWARDTSGQRKVGVAAAPPRAKMNSRRFIRSPRRRSTAATAAP